MLKEIFLGCFPQNSIVNKKKLYYEFALNNYSTQFRNSYNINRLTNSNHTKIFEENDRNDVILMLPDLKKKKILEIGFDVGRFTIELANRGKYIDVTDLNFCSYNKLKLLEGLANKSNKSITVRTSSIPSTNYKSQKFHLIFTNWLFMYLNDEECYQFLNKSLNWLKKNGNLKFRESILRFCDQNIDTYSNSLGYQYFPTYRYISVYLKLIEGIRIKDKKGFKWKYEVTICSVIPTCVEKAYKWDEVQLIAKKVKASNKDKVPDKLELLDNITDDWVNSQEAANIYTDTIEEFFADKIFLKEIKKCPVNCFENSNKMTATIIYQSSANPYYMRICPFNMPTTKKSFIWTNEEDRSFFQSYLSIAEKEKNPSMFFSYSKNKMSSLFEYVAKRDICLNGFLSVNFLSDKNLNFVDEFFKNANKGAKIILLESYLNDYEKEIKLQKIKCPFIVVCRTKKIHKIVMKEKYSKGIMEYITLRKWMLIKIAINKY
uniref:phosphoethanolamine N-methyltransferase n=2 Tax=Strongyloides stercoralis TaxID=6248 RepID=A0A0K0ENA7_STRER